MNIEAEEQDEHPVPERTAEEPRPMAPDEMVQFEKSIVQGEGESVEEAATPLRPPITPW
jgi:hypothetical protein